MAETERNELRRVLYSCHSFPWAVIWHPPSFDGPGQYHAEVAVNGLPHINYVNTPDEAFAWIADRVEAYASKTRDSLDKAMDALSGNTDAMRCAKPASPPPASPEAEFGAAGAEIPVDDDEFPFDGYDARAIAESVCTCLCTIGVVWAIAWAVVECVRATA